MSQRFFQWMTSGNEPRIWITTDRNGKSILQAYDPVNGARTRLGSEAEMRAWLEQRYYR